MWCLPTHKRPKKLRRFLATVADSDQEENVLLVVWRDDPFLKEYMELMRDSLPRQWDVWVNDPRTCGAKLEHVFKSFPNESFYGFLADDIGLGTPGMLGELRRDALAGSFAWPNDGVHGPRMATHPAAPGRFLRALGFWAHPLFPHNGLDTVLYRVSEAVGISKYRADLHLIHYHPFISVSPNNAWNSAEWDETYDEAREMNTKAIEDMYRFQQTELPQIINRMKETYRGEEVQG